MKTNSQAASTLTIENKCKGPHSFNVGREETTFIEYELAAPVRVGGQQSFILPIRFNTAGLNPGKYGGNLQVICLDCKAEPTCTQDRDNLPVRLTVTGSLDQPGGGISVTHGEVIPLNPQAQPESPPRPDVPQEYFLPSGMQKLNPVFALKWWASPFPPPGVWWWQCCCCCPQSPIVQPQPSPPNQPPAAPPINVSVNLEVGAFGPGKAIHILYVVAPAQYAAEAYIQWTASGGRGQLTVDLDVQKPGSSTWTRLVSGRGPSDHYLFSTNTPGTYVFRATARDSSGNSAFNTTTVDFPRI